MKKKINRMFVVIASLAILSTMLLITLVYYDLFRQQVMEDLRAYVVLFEGCGSENEIEQLGNRLEQYGMRITVVLEDGTVIYDNEADCGQMENHSDRPEIKQAFLEGEGQIVRRSDTLAKSTFYFAARLTENKVIRIAKDAGSIYSIFSKVIPSLIITFAVLIALSMILAHFLTGKLIRPIEQMAENLDVNNDTTDYEELTPFIEMIRKQHQDIVKNASMRQEFTANVSHELKTPLTSISGYAELIETGMASEKDVIRFAAGIRNSANRLLTLINDTIRLSQLDGGEDDMVFERLNMYELASECVDALAMSAKKHEVSISLAGVECYIEGDKQMMEELLYNLCDNAIRYNNVGGKVEVKVEYEKSVQPGGEQPHVVLTVRDTGIGIPKEHQERIFERFYRVDKSRSKSTGGTGLGLAIVKHIVAKHNAKIQIVSEEGKGTEITVIL